jgi:hypothetical protein
MQQLIIVCANDSYEARQQDIRAAGGFIEETVEQGTGTEALQIAGGYRRL